MRRVAIFPTVSRCAAREYVPLTRQLCRRAQLFAQRRTVALDGLTFLAVPWVLLACSSMGGGADWVRIHEQNNPVTSSATYVDASYATYFDASYNAGPDRDGADWTAVRYKIFASQGWIGLSSDTYYVRRINCRNATMSDFEGGPDGGLYGKQFNIRNDKRYSWLWKVACDIEGPTPIGERRARAEGVADGLQ